MDTWHKTSGIVKPSIWHVRFVTFPCLSGIGSVDYWLCWTKWNEINPDRAHYLQAAHMQKTWKRLSVAHDTVLPGQRTSRKGTVLCNLLQVHHLPQFLHQMLSISSSFDTRYLNRYDTLCQQSVSSVTFLLLFSGDALKTNGKYLQRAAAFSCGYRKHAHPTRRLTTSQKYEKPNYRLHITVKRDFDEFWKETLKVALLSAWTTIPLEHRSQMHLELKLRLIYLFPQIWMTLFQCIYSLEQKTHIWLSYACLLYSIPINCNKRLWMCGHKRSCFNSETHFNYAQMKGR